jgi:hypothetical protein
MARVARGWKVWVGAGAALVIGAAVWRPAVVPQLVRFPDDTHQHAEYAGTFVTFVDSATGATLATPRTEPLSIRRNIDSVAGRTGARSATVSERVVARLGDRTDTQTRTYTLDRRSMRNVGTAAGAAAGSYYVTLPLGFDERDVAFSMYKPETGTTYRIFTAPAAPTEKVADLRVTRLAGTLAPTPVSAAYRDVLAGQGLPMELTPAQVAAQLAAAGVPIDAIGALNAILTPGEQATLADALAKPVPLQYFAYGSGSVAAEHNTGMLVQLRDIVDGISVKPDLSGLGPLVTILERHRDLAPVANALDALNATATAPAAPVYELRYTQTPASVKATAGDVRDQLRSLRLVADAPYVLAVAGLVLVALGTRRRLRTMQPAAAPVRGVAVARSYPRRSPASHRPLHGGTTR